MKQSIFRALIATALIAPAAAMAADSCAVSISSTDAMRFSTKSISIPASCKKFSITLQHVGKLPKAAMGHNIVISSAADMGAIVSDSIIAGAANDYLKPGDTRVIAHSKMIGGGETAMFDVPVSKLKVGGPYVFFCSFPGHSALMKGTVQVTQ